MKGTAGNILLNNIASCEELLLKSALWQELPPAYSSAARCSRCPQPVEHAVEEA